MATGQSDNPLPPVITITGRGLHLREWADNDVPVMAQLFDEPEVGRWTPLPFPFGIPAAESYLARARHIREAGAGIHLAITTDGQEPLGEILLYWTGEHRRDAELAYAIGARYRRQRLALRAVQLMTSYAYDQLTPKRVILLIEADNQASNHVARAANFQRTDEPPTIRKLKHRTVTLLTWSHHPCCDSRGHSDDS
jgi:RimJ/RimL family protein N-acetyltransferase